MGNGDTHFSTKEFWEDKILGWEEGRYGRRDSSPSFLERIANSSSASLRFRMHFASEILGPRVSGKNVLEIGCGSGYMAEGLSTAGVGSYAGIDITASAIENARRMAAEKSLGNNIRFETGSAEGLQDVNPDVVFSLGLFDWLSDNQLDSLFELTREAEFLHSFSEKRGALSQFIHRAYCYIAYGHRTKGYAPKYHTVAHLAGIAGRHGFGPLYVVRDARLSFGAFLTTFPIKGCETV